LSIVTLGVGDLGRAVAFYRDGLGWPLSAASEEDIAFFRTVGVVLALYPREALAEDVGVDPAGGGFPGFTLAHNVADRETVDSTLAGAASAGARIVKEARDASWGGRSGYFADHDGHLGGGGVGSRLLVRREQRPRAARLGSPMGVSVS
jgi:hypothetical protein